MSAGLDGRYEGERPTRLDDAAREKAKEPEPFAGLPSERVTTMAWIQLTSVREATGLLKKQYDAALARAGRVWNIVRIMSPNPRILDASMKLYEAIMKGPSPLSRAQREMLATVVSAELGCRY